MNRIFLNLESVWTRPGYNGRFLTLVNQMSSCDNSAISHPLLLLFQMYFIHPISFLSSDFPLYWDEILTEARGFVVLAGSLTE